MAEKRYICLHNSARFYSYFYLNRRFFFPYSLPQARVIFQCCCLLSRPCFHVCNIEFFLHLHYYPPHSAQSANENTTTYMECDSCWVPNGHNEPVVLFSDLVFMFATLNFFYIFLACWIYIVNKGDLWLKHAYSTSACLSGHPVLSKDPVLILDTTAFDLLEEPKESVFIKNMVSVLKGLNLEKM